MNFSNLAYSFQQHIDGLSIDDRQCATFLKLAGFIKQSTEGKGTKFHQAKLKYLFQLADRCEQMFLLPHSGNNSIYLVGAIFSGAELAKPQTENVFAGGRGFSLADAFIGCLQELSERIATRNWVPEVSDENVPHIADAEPEWWKKFQTGQSIGETYRTSGTAIHSGNVYGFPWAGRTGYFGHSHGCATGDTIAQATTHAAFELAERHAVAKWWFEKSPAPAPSFECQTQLARVFTPGAEINRHRWLLDLSFDSDIPVVAAISCDASGRGLIGGFAGDRTLPAAALRASLELCQMEAAAMLAKRKQDELGTKTLTHSDKMWIARLNTDPVLHARPSYSNYGVVVSSTDCEKPERYIGSAYLFDMSDAESPLKVVRLVATELHSVVQGEGHPEGEGGAGKFPTFEEFPAPV